MATLREVKKRIRTVKSTLGISFDILVFMLMVTSSGFGFDGRKQGFVLGGGLGASPLSHWALGNGGSDYGETGAGAGLNFLIGFASNEQDVLAIEYNYALWNSSDLNGLIAQGFNGITWNHYFSPLSPSTFMTLGLGLYFFEGEGFSGVDPSIGGLIGAGAELSRHWQLGGYFSIGSSSVGRSDFNLHHVSFLFSYMAY